MADIPGSTTYRVTWQIAGQLTEHVNNVAIIPGYSSEEDIPAILAVRNIGRSSDAVSVRVLEKEKI